MKNTFRLLLGMSVMVLALGLVFTGCASKPTVYDASVPTEQSSTLKIKACWVKEFNGKETNWGSAFSMKQIIIPAGQHSLLIFNKFENNEGYQVVNYHDEILMHFEFLPNHTYLITMSLNKINKRFTARIIDEASFGYDLVPDTSSPDATPLEGKWVNTKIEGNQLIFAKNEFIFITNGKYYGRGFFYFDGQDVSIPISAVYNKDKWVLLDKEMEIGGYSRFTYDGTTLISGKIEFKKME